MKRKRPRYPSAAALAERAAWSAQWFHCHCCRGPRPLETHEIAPRSRTNECMAKCNWLALCRPCHAIIQGMDAEFQAALKLLADPSEFDLKELNRLRQRAPDAIEYQSVKAWSEVIKAVRGE